MIHFDTNPKLFWGALPFVAMCMDEKELLSCCSVSAVVNELLSSNALWEKHLYTRSCTRNLEEGGAKLRYFEHLRVFRSFFGKKFKIELPKNFSEVREVVEQKLKKNGQGRTAKLSNFFRCELKRFIELRDFTERIVCDRNMRMLLKEGAKVKTLMRPNFLEQAVIHGCSFKTIEMLFNKRERCGPVYIYDAIVSRDCSKHTNELPLFLAEQITSIKSKDQFRFCNLLETQVSDAVIENLAGKVEEVCLETLLCANKNNKSPKTIEILYGNFKLEHQKDTHNLLDIFLSENRYTSATVKKIIVGVPEIEENRVCEMIIARFSDDIIGLAVDRVKTVSLRMLEEAIEGGYSVLVIYKLLYKLGQDYHITQKILCSAMENKYPDDIIHFLIEKLNDGYWIKLPVYEAAEQGEYGNKVVKRLKEWHLRDWSPENVDASSRKSKRDSTGTGSGGLLKKGGSA